jgi:hypothetical protein
MATLHIEHPISDYDTWKGAFDRFAEARGKAGVTSHRIRQPENDLAFIVVDLEFDEAEQAHAYLGFLRETVWSNADNAPALAGDPVARVLLDRD